VITLRELLEKLKREEETYLLELLDIRSDELVERFADYVEEMYDELAKDFDEDDYEEKELTGDIRFGGYEE
jgi:hypothetical protein